MPATALLNCVNKRKKLGQRGLICLSNKLALPLILSLKLLFFLIVFSLWEVFMSLPDGSYTSPLSLLRLGATY